MLRELFVQLDAHPAIYWWFGSASVASLAIWLGRVRGAANAGKRRLADRTAPWLLLGLLLAGRWPMLFETKAVGPAEARLIDGALTMAVDPFPFRSADLLESGPLAALALLPTHWLGVPQDYFNARLVALLLDWATLVTAYFFLRRFFPEFRAMLLLLPAAIMFALPVGRAVWEYSPDHLALSLTVLGAGLLWPAGREDGNDWRATAAWMGAGLCLGMLPWVDAGSAVVAAGLWLGAMAAAGRSSRRAGVARAGALALYCTAAVLALLHGTGQWDNFWVGYVRREPAGPAAGFRIADWPLSCWLGAAAVAAWGGARLLRATGWAGKLLWPALPLIVVIQLSRWVAQGTPEIFGHLAEQWRHPYSEMGRRLRRMRQTGDSLAVWGCRPQLYVEAGLPQAVRSATSARELTEAGGPRDSLRQRYLAEMERKKPAFFVDAAGPGAGFFADRAVSGHEGFRELGAFVQKYYRLVGDDGQARFYVRHDWMEQWDGKFPGVVRLTLPDMKVAEALAGVAELDYGRISANAPSRLTHAVPGNVRILRGMFGFFEGSYEKPGAATDGALFVIETVTTAGQRARLLERRLDPARNPADRGPVEFAVELPAGPLTEVEFIIEPGATRSYDWTYWGSLQFDRGTLLPGEGEK